MSHFLSEEFMLGLLREIQPQQSRILRAGFSAHLDVNTNDHSSLDDDPQGHHITIDLTVFDGSDIKKTYEFDPLETEEQNRARLSLLIADVNAM